MRNPPFLQPGDTIAFAAPARFIRKDEIQAAHHYLSEKGYHVLIPEGLFEQEHQLAGSDRHRAEIINHLMMNPDVKAIWFARGGYGCGRIVDQLDFEWLLSHPKWLIGFSDVTVLLNHVVKYHPLITLHAPMLLQFDPNNPLYDEQGIERSLKYLTGHELSIELPHHPLNRTGHAKGKLVGGNLSVLYSLNGTASFPDTKDCILFLEDLDEYLYHLDRMMLQLRRSGVLENLKALLIGGMSDMHDNATPFGKTAEEIVKSYCEGYEYPVYMGIPSGHIVPNFPLPIGEEVEIFGNTLFLPARSS